MDRRDEADDPEFRRELDAVNLGEGLAHALVDHARATATDRGLSAKVVLENAAKYIAGQAEPLPSEIADPGDDARHRRN